MQTPINPFKQALARGDVQWGLWLGLASGYSAELCAGVGFDWLLLDGEHAPNDIPTLLAQLQGVASASAPEALPPGRPRSHPVVRVPIGTGDVGTALIKQTLDLGAQTLMVPMVDTPEQAAQVAAACRYPPEGVRGMGAALARATRWQQYPQYVHEANAQICLLVQVETATAMDHLDAIAATPGVDGVFIGPADLSASMGYPGQPDHPEVLAAIHHGLQRIRKAGKAPGILGFSPAQVQPWLNAGAQFVAVGIEALVLKHGLRQLLSTYRPGCP